MLQPNSTVRSATNPQSFWARSNDSGFASSSSSQSDKSMTNHSGITPLHNAISIATDSGSFYRSPGAFKIRRRCPPITTALDLIMSLPDDCLLRVASELSQYDLVNMMRCCKRFHDVGSASSSWKVIDFGDRVVSAEIIMRLIVRGTTVLRLCGTHIIDPLPENDEHLITKLTHLDATRLSFSTDGKSILTKIVTSSTMLTHLSLSGCEITLEIATHLSHIHTLSHLDLSMCSNLTPHHLSLILTKSGRFIVELNVSCSQVGREGGMVIATHCSSRLLRLDLSGSAPFDNQEDSIDDDVVAAIVKNCPKVFELVLSDSPKITDAGFQKLMTLRDLEALSLSRCYGIHPHEYMNATHLTQLSIFGLISQEGIQTIREELVSTTVNDLELALSKVARATPPPHVSSLWGVKVKPFNC